MIKPNELRIGNLVLNEFNLVAEVDSVDLPSNTIQTVHNGARYLDRFIGVHPIPLTEDWLLKFGFVRSKDLNVNYDFIDMGTGYFAISERDEVYKLCVGRNLYGQRFKFVHQLQNLYFALTGEELTIRQPATSPLPE